MVNMELNHCTIFKHILSKLLKFQTLKVEKPIEPKHINSKLKLKLQLKLLIEFDSTYFGFFYEGIDRKLHCDSILIWKKM